jgi:hypothetical protein
LGHFNFSVFQFFCHNLRFHFFLLRGQYSAEQGEFRVSQKQLAVNQWPHSMFNSESIAARIMRASAGPAGGWTSNSASGMLVGGWAIG